MNIRSIRVRLPVSYALIALLTAGVLGSILLVTLQSYYQTQEYDYLATNAELMAPGIGKVMEVEQSLESLQIYIQNLSYLIQARIRVLDVEDNLLVDSGSLQTQQFVYTNLTPEGMSAEIFREGRADKFQFYALINVIAQPFDAVGLGENPVFLAQDQSQPALFGVRPGTQGSKEIQHSRQLTTVTVTGSSGQVFGTLEVSEGLAFGGTIIENVARAWSAASAAAVIIAGLSGWLVSRRMTLPLMALTDATERMAAGELSYRTEIKTRDEFNLLGQSFNTMAEKLENMIATLRSFVADAAHELLTPVAALSVNLELAENGENAEQFLKEAQAQTARLQALVDSLLDLSKIEAVSTLHDQLSLIPLMSEIFERYSPVANQKGISLTIDLPSEDVSILGDKAQISRAVENLVDNAIKFSESGGKVNLWLKGEDQIVRIGVEDHGIGIPENEQHKVFQRFYRGRNTSSYAGSGLGLAIVKAIADQHGVVVDLKSSPEGTCVRLIFSSNRLQKS